MFGRSTREICSVSALLLFASAASALGCRAKADAFRADAGAPLVASAQPVVPSASAPALRPLGITWVDPPGLKRVPALSPIYKASYVVPRASGDTEDGELAVFHLGPAEAGPTDANIEHWVSQFSGVKPSDLKRVEHDAGGLHERTVEILHGTFDAGPTTASASQPKQDYALEGALVEGPNGAYSFKMTGPARTVAAGRSAFMQLLSSVHSVRPDH